MTQMWAMAWPHGDMTPPPHSHDCAAQATHPPATVSSVSARFLTLCVSCFPASCLPSHYPRDIHTTISLSPPHPPYMITRTYKHLYIPHPPLTPAAHMLTFYCYCLLSVSCWFCFVSVSFRSFGLAVAPAGGWLASACCLLLSRC